jgi:hypothetical protein
MKNGEKISIDRGVAVATTVVKNKQGRKLAYPFTEMLIGDSFIINKESKVRVAYSNFKKKNPWFKALIAKDIAGQLRLWRVSNEDIGNKTKLNYVHNLSIEMIKKAMETGKTYASAAKLLDISADTVKRRLTANY